MGKIRILEDRVIDKIAAGEIVERPASIVKELIENSIDAKATAIEIDIASGGKDRIRIMDDGEGMDRDDLVLAFERHATSKILNEDDLSSISTMGFRGEAIPSIASVSIMTVQSGTDQKKSGSEVHARGGEIVHVVEIQPCRGTTVEVKSIFFNTPARKKFLKSPDTELSHIIAVVQNFALSFHGIRFVLRSGKREILNLPPASTKIDRIAQLFGAAFSKRLYPFASSGGSFLIDGYISDITESRKNRTGQHFFINGRCIKDRIISSATLNAYRSYFVDSHPSLFLFLEVDPSMVDFNVHPAKLEVRFSDQQGIYRMIQQSLLSCMSGSDVSQHVYAFSGKRSGEGRVSEGAESGALPFSAFSQIAVTPDISTAMAQLGAAAKDWKIIGQHLDTYIIAGHGNDIFIIDQHIAHERVLYENLLKDAREGRIEKQKLMFPITMEVSPSEAAWIEENRDLIIKAAFVIECFGSGTVKIEEIPSHMRIDSAVSLVRDIASSHVHAEQRADDDELSKLISSLACHSAVRAGEKLAPAKMEFILESLFRCSNPHVCPHGRPIFMLLESSELARHFKRKS